LGRLPEAQQVGLDGIDAVLDLLAELGVGDGEALGLPVLGHGARRLPIRRIAAFCWISEWRGDRFGMCVGL
jgi:hypothetical protein